MCRHLKDVEIIFSTTSGAETDGKIKFGQVFTLTIPHPRMVLLLRQKELVEFDSFLSKVRDDQIAEKKMSGEQKVKFMEAFAAFRKTKTQKMVDQVIAHELGHILGLGHNFNAEEMSVMDYSDRSVPSEYDADALSYRFGLKRKIDRTWNAMPSPGLEHTQSNY